MALLFVPYKTVTHMLGGMTTPEYREIPEYIISVLKMGGAELLPLSLV